MRLPCLFFLFFLLGSMCCDPLCHFLVSLVRECACRGCSDELGCEPEKFFVGVFADICDDLLFGVCWVCVSGVFDGAHDSDLADCLELVCVAYDVADEGVVWHEEGVVVERGACKDCFVFRGVGYVLDDFLDVFVVADVFVAEVVECLLKRSVVVILVVCDVVEPSGGDGVQNEVVVMPAVGEIHLDQISSCCRDGLHVRVSVGLVSAGACFLNEVG